MDNETLTVLHELDNTLKDLTKKYEDESIFSELFVLGINAAQEKVRDKIIELTVAKAIAKATEARKKYE